MVFASQRLSLLRPIFTRLRSAVIPVSLAVLGLTLLTACGPSDSSSATLPPGDAANGAILFAQTVNGAPACNSCHTVDGTKSTGPTLQGYSAHAGTQVAGQDATTYTVASITRPAAFTVSGYANLMYNQYRQLLSPQQLADLVAYLLTL